MRVRVFPSKDALGASAAALAADKIRGAIAEKGEAAVILATGASQFETLEHLVRADGIDWSKTTVFHLDEYVGLPDSHPASFRKYLKERFADKVRGLKEFVYVRGDASDPVAECRRLGSAISARTIDVACIGIGENGHIAFNDPPADFITEEPYLVVDLDEACRRQQLGEGWFPTLRDVPSRAISMSVRRILRARCLVVAVPDSRKAEAVRKTIESEISPEVPASILRSHPDCTLFLDRPAASRIPERLTPDVEVSWA
jgi:glucosamine-6-phosphate deaminase